jgi:hypothetical protein
MDNNKKDSQNDDIKLEDFNQDESIRGVIEKFNLDPEADEDLIIKLVESEKENHKKLSEAIGQKIKYRNEAEILKSSSGEKEKKPASESLVDVSKAVQEALDKRDLEEMNLSDDLKEELEKLAKITGTSVKKASQDPYFIFKKEQYQKDEKIHAASISTKNTGAQAYVDTAEVPKVDLSTEEGRKQWQEWKSAKKNSK